MDKTSVAKKDDFGKDPTSNTQFTFTLKKIVDAIRFVDNGKALNVYKV